jgi:hypothetical protein
VLLGGAAVRQPLLQRRNGVEGAQRALDRRNNTLVPDIELLDEGVDGLGVPRVGVTLVTPIGDRADKRARPPG